MMQSLLFTQGMMIQSSKQGGSLRCSVHTVFAAVDEAGRFTNFGDTTSLYNAFQSSSLIRATDFSTLPILMNTYQILRREDKVSSTVLQCLA
jgi:hypothetical protein